MRLHSSIRHFALATVVVGLFCGVSSATTPAAKHSTSKAHAKTVHGKSSKHRRSKKGAWKRHGQQKIDAARASQIQEALIREKYLDGQPTGVWDSRTESAMQRFQTDNGWQSKVTPDSRALIKLGLGPNHEIDLTNVDTKSTGSAAVTTAPAASTSAKRR